MSVKIDVVSNSAAAERDLKQVNDTLKSIDKSANKVSSTFSHMLVGLASAASIVGAYTSLKNVADTFTNLGNKIALVTGRTADLAYAQEKLLKISNDTRSTIDNSAMAFSTFGKALKGTRATVDQILLATTTVQQAVAISGSTADSARAAIVQLGQGLSSGTLRGEELNSVMEQTPRIAQAIAEELGVGLGQLRKIAMEGKLTSDVVFKAMVNQSAQIAEEFSVLTPTMAQSTNQLSQAISEFIHGLDEGLNLSGGISTVIINMANSIRGASATIGVDASIFLTKFQLGLDNILLVARPILSIITSLGDQLVRAMPSVELTTTIKGQALEGLRLLDDAFGGMFHKLYLQGKYFWTDLFAFDSPVEKAVKALQRLDPRSWATGRFDRQTMQRFFSVDSLRNYAVALEQLAVSVEANTNWIGNQISENLRRIRQLVTNAATFIGAIPDTLINFKIGGVDAISESITELTRGFTGLVRKVWDLGRLFADITGQSYTQLFNALTDAVNAAPLAMSMGFSEFVKEIGNLIVHIAQILVNFWSTSFKQPIRDVKTELSNIIGIFRSFASSLVGLVTPDTFFEKIQSKASKMASSVSGTLSNFNRSVINYFADIYNKVVGHSWWTSTMDGVVAGAENLVKRIKAPLSNLKEQLQVAVFKSDMYLARLTVNAADALKTDLGSSMGNKLLENFAKRSMARTFDSSPLTEFRDQVDLIFTAIAVHATLGLEKTYLVIRHFATSTIAYFKDIYDKVIGHSYWVDTVNGVINETDRMYQRTKQSLTLFQIYVTGVFKDIFNKRASVKDIALKVKITSKDIGAEAFKTLYNNFIGFLDRVNREFPLAMKSAMLAVGGLAVHLLFPKGTIRQTLVGLITVALLTSGTLAAERFGQNLFGNSFVTAGARSFGEVLGSMFSSFVNEIPARLNVLLTIISGFVRGFLSELPLGLGAVFKTLFGLATGLGISGPLGLFGMVLFGRYGILPLIGNTKLFGTKIEVMVKSIGGYFKALLTGGAAAKGLQAGWFMNALFGKMGYARFAGILGTIGTSLGIFDSLFSGSRLTQYAVEGGLLYLAMFGSAGWQTIVNLSLRATTSVVKSVDDLISKYITSQSGQGLIASLLGTNQPQGTLITNARAFIGGIMSKLGGMVVDFVAKWGKRGMSFVERMLFGEDPTATLGNFSKLWASIKTSFSTQLASLAAYSKKFNILSGLFSGGNAKATIQSTAGALSNTIEGVARTAEMSAIRSVGAQGILGTMFFGPNAKKWGIAGVTAAALLLMAGLARASEKPAEGVAYSIWSHFLDDLKYIASRPFHLFDRDDENPMFSWISVGLLAAIPLYLKFANVIGPMVSTAVSSAFDTSKVNIFTRNLTRLQALTIPITTNFQNIGRAILSFGIGASLVAALGGSMQEVALYGLLAATAIQGVVKVVQGMKAGTILAFAEEFGMIGMVIFNTFKFIFASVGGLILGSVLSGLYVMVELFGEGFSFGEKLADIWWRIKQNIGMADKNIRSMNLAFNEMISPKKRKESPIEINYDFRNVDFTKVSDKQKDIAEKLVKELDDVLDRATEEKLKFGKPTDATIKAIEDRQKEVKTLITKLEGLVRPDMVSDFKDLNKFNQGTRSGSINRYKDKASQPIFDAMHDIRLVSARAQLSKDPSNYKLQKELEEAMRQKDRAYKAGYKIPDAITKELEKVMEGFDPTVDLIGSPEFNTNMRKGLESALTNWKKEHENYANLFNSKAPERQMRIAARVMTEADDNLRAIGKYYMELQRSSTEVAKFQKSIKDTAAAMEELGIKVDNPVFTKLFDSPMDLAKYFEAAVKVSKTEKEAIQNFKSAREIKERLKIQFKHYDADNFSNIYDQLATAAKDSGSSIDPKIFDNMPLEILEQLKGAFRKVEEKTSALKMTLRPGIDIGIDKQALWLAQEDLRKALESAWKTGGSTAEKMDLFDQLGIKTPDFVLLDHSVSSLNKLQIQQDKLRKAQGVLAKTTATPGEKLSAWKDKAAAERAIAEGWKEAPIKSMSSLISDLGSIGFTTTFEDILKVNPSTFAGLKKAAEAVSAIQESFSLRGSNNMGKERMAEYTKTILEAKEKAFQATLTIPKNLTGVLERINKVGGSLDLATAVRLPPEIIEQYDNLAVAIERNRHAADASDVTPDRLFTLNQSWIYMMKLLRELGESSSDFEGKLKFINSIFSDADVSPEDWAKMTDGARKSLFKLAQEQRNYQEILNQSRNFSDEEVIAAQQAIAANRRSSVDLIASTLESSRRIAKAMSEAGINTEADQIATLGLPDQKKLENLVNALNKAKRELKDTSDPEARIVKSRAIEQQGKDLSQFLQEAVERTIKDFRIFDTAGLSVEKATYNLLDSQNRNILTGMAQAIINAKVKVNSLENDPALQAKAQEVLDGLNKTFVKVWSEMSIKWEDTAVYQAGQTLVANMMNSLQTGIADAISGKISGSKALKSVADTFTNTIIDQFVNGMIQAVTGKDSLFEKIFQGLGSGVFSFGKGLLGGNTKKEEQFAATAMDNAAMAMRELTNVLLGMTPGFNPSTGMGYGGSTGIGGPEADNEAMAEAMGATTQATVNLGDTFLSGFTGVSRILKGDILGGLMMMVNILQSSSIVKGAMKGLGGIMGGTSGSDGIMGFLGDAFISIFGASKGAAFNHGLQAFARGGIINSPTLFRMAKGGLGLMGEAGPEAILPLSRGKGGRLGVEGGGSQIFNINITGDVSRQTRSEIQRMIPQIASGVNQHNYEKGYQR